MSHDEIEKMHERLRRRKLIEDWKTEAKAIQAADPAKRMLLRQAKIVALKRIEDSARTEADFEKLIQLWENIQIVENWRVSKQEKLNFDHTGEYELSDRDAVIPEPELVWWRQQMSGSFLDVTFDCPYDIEELTASRPVYQFTKELSEDQKEILYYRVIRQWSPQAIAALRGQTDRNIRKVYGNTLENIRRKLFIRLAPRHIFDRKWPLTTTQRKFCEEYWEGLDWKQRGKIMRKIEENQRKKRNAIGSGDGE